MTTTIIIAIVTAILSAFLIVRFIKSYRVKKMQKEIEESKHVTEKEKIRVYLDKVNEETRKKRR